MHNLRLIALFGSGAADRSLCLAMMRLNSSIPLSSFSTSPITSFLFLRLVWKVNVLEREKQISVRIFFRIGGAMKIWGVTEFFSWEIGGSQKKIKRLLGGYKFQWKFCSMNSPKMHIFRATCIRGYIFLHHCSSGGGGGSHKNFWSSNRGVTKILPRYFRKFMIPIPKKMVAPLALFLEMLHKTVLHSTEKRVLYVL